MYLAATTTTNSATPPTTTSTTSPIPSEHGACLVCTPLSNTILLIQALILLLLLILILPLIFNFPLAKTRGLGGTQSQKIRDRYTTFSLLWTLALVVHATVKWLTDPWATYYPENGKEESEGEDVGGRQQSVRLVTNMCNVVVIVGFTCAMLVGDWVGDKILRRCCGLGKDEEGRWAKRGAGEERPLREEEEREEIGIERQDWDRVV